MKINKRFKKLLYIYALFFILCLSVVTMAKYTGQINGSGEMTIAKWDVSILGNDNQQLDTITIGDSNTYPTYKLTIESKSDVAVDYSLIMRNVPHDLIVRIYQDDEASGTDYTPESSRININKLGSFIANDTNKTRIYYLKFIVPIDSDTINPHDIYIDVTFKQVNP